MFKTLFRNEMQVISLTVGAEVCVYIYTFFFFKLAEKVSVVSFLNEGERILPCLTSVKKSRSRKKKKELW